MSQMNGALCQIGPTTDALVACTQIDNPVPTAAT
jgi:hypothetical protein